MSALTFIQQKTTLTQIISLVLSCWKKSIDLASMLCHAKGIKHVCIDGSVPQSQRRAALSDFVNDENISVLFMTMGTGALGLVVVPRTRMRYSLTYPQA